MRKSGKSGHVRYLQDSEYGFELLPVPFEFVLLQREGLELGAGEDAGPHAAAFVLGTVQCFQVGAS